MASAAEKVFAGVSYLALRQVASGLAALLSAVLLVRHFGPAGFGVYMLALGVVGLCAIATGSSEEALRRFLPERVARGEHRSARHLFALVLSARLTLALLVAGALFFVAPVLTRDYAGGVLPAFLLRVGALLLFALAAEAVAAGTFLGLGRFGMPALFGLLSSAVALLLAVLTVVLDLDLPTFFALSMGLHLAAAGAFLGAAARALAAATSGPAAAAPAPREDLGRLWRYTWPLWGNSAAELAYRHAARVILGALAPVAVVGYFSLAKNLIEQVSGVLGQFRVVLVPTLSEWSEAEAEPRLGAALAAVAAWVGPLGLLAGLGLFVLAPDVIQIVGGAGFAPAVPVLQIYAFQLPFRLMTNVWGTFYYVRERTPVLLRLMVLRLVPMLLLMPVAVVAAGAAGAAAVEVAYFAGGLLLFWVHLPRISTIPRRALAAPPVRLALPAVLTVALLALAPDARLWRWLLAAALPLLLLATGSLGADGLRALAAAPGDSVPVRWARPLAKWWLARARLPLDWDLR